MIPAPGAKHQRASSRLWHVLDAAAEAAGAPVEVLKTVNVVLPEGLFIPDIAVVDARTVDEDPVACEAEAVLLVVVVSSPASRRIDRLFKPPFYADGGIEHLWRLELEPVPALIVSQLENGRYMERTVAEEGRMTLIEKPFPVEADPAALVRRKR
ncbi:hypothetical protein SBI_04922 [Streptomyces bingchenggensis BCW-1]|uniref:Putative restriction endonuclease domain-containing protein n=1 Tax=Streptomyces bingchenggensis (strain BCW-1) TaxID=749414 RepID=D7C2Y0_STRBB|nr:MULTISPECIES: Uma2 family endonuclease [Streptomyces]ADI08042.1 hypothetical protein SBI_04922 [Streptomyces bingchenggensis BCW-1]